MNTPSTKDRFLAAHNLLSDEATSLEKFESIRELLRGLNPKIDKVLYSCSKAISDIENMQKGDVISLSIDNLPETTEKEKKRKKTLVLFIRNFKTLQSEVERIRGEIESSRDDLKGMEEQVSSFGKIMTFSKGPFGIITILAILIAGFLVFRADKSQEDNQPSTLNSSPSPVSVNLPSPIPTPAPVTKQKIQVINFNGKKIPLSELEVRTGPDCTNSPVEAPHYHAKNGRSVKAIDGTEIADPVSCAFGKVSEATIEEIETQ